MKEAESPYFSIEEGSLAHYGHDFVIEVNVLQHPEDLPGFEHVGVEDVAFLDVVEDLYLVA